MNKPSQAGCLYVRQHKWRAREGAEARLGVLLVVHVRVLADPGLQLAGGWNQLWKGGGGEGGGLGDASVM